MTSNQPGKKKGKRILSSENCKSSVVREWVDLRKDGAFFHLVKAGILLYCEKQWGETDSICIIEALVSHPFFAPYLVESLM